MPLKIFLGYFFKKKNLHYPYFFKKKKKDKKKVVKVKRYANGMRLVRFIYTTRNLCYING